MKLTQERDVGTEVLKSRVHHKDETVYVGNRGVCTSLAKLFPCSLSARQLESTKYGYDAAPCCRVAI